NLAGGDSCQRREDRLWIELRTGKGKLRVVEEPLGGSVFPTLPGLEATVVEAGEERSGIHSRHLDAELLELETHRFRDCLDRMLGRRINAREWIRIQALSRRYPDNPSTTAFDHLLGDPLSQHQRPDDVDVELMTHIRFRYVDDGAT